MITSRSYRYLTDFPMIRQFLTEIYEKDWRNGVPAPFVEYAFCATWMDHNYLHRNTVWFDGEKVVAFAFAEGEVTEAFFALRPGYDFLAAEMIEKCESYMVHKDNKVKLTLFGGQTALIEAAKEKGYTMFNTWEELLWDFEKEPELNFTLPEGYRFEERGRIDPKKRLICYWKGFDHEKEEGSWPEENINDEYLLATAPHYSNEYTVAVVAPDGSYACCAGMWWTPENKLAYMEPLATVPEHRRKGLAAAALTELSRRMKPLGATHMTGGGDVFYRKLGVFKPMIAWTQWEKSIKAK